MERGVKYKRVAALREPSAFREYIDSLGIELHIDDTVTPAPGGALAQPFTLNSGRRIGNRLCVLPMEGWDGTRDGRPADLTRRRWINFGRSGAKLIWGGEAAAVRPEGRANPHQLMINDGTAGDFESLRNDLAAAHRERFGTAGDLFIGLQLTHSGRFCRPKDNAVLEPKIAYHHPILDRLFSVPDDFPVLTDGELEGIIADYVRAAVLAQQAGYDFVDVKHCHGYLGHELLSARTRIGGYGGSLENRTRFLREIVQGIQRDAAGLEIGVRLSVFDFPPFRADGPGEEGKPLHRREDGPYPYAFGADPEDPLRIKLDEVTRLLQMLRELGVQLICTTAGSPYYNPHIQRPALFPPSDGYLPPEDPLAGVARQINVTAELKKQFPDLVFAGSAYTYLQEWFPAAAQYAVGNGLTDFAGLGRMMLSYPEMPADILAGIPPDRKKICRTFSECTTAPRKGLVSGCYPLDPLYKKMPKEERHERIRTDTRGLPR